MVTAMWPHRHRPERTAAISSVCSGAGRRFHSGGVFMVSGAAGTLAGRALAFSRRR
jgi:hypothetical protein